MATPSQRASAATYVSRFLNLAALALLVAPLFAAPASASVAVRVEARPISDPIQVFVRVSDGTDPVPGLVANDFTVTVDGGSPIAIQPGDFILPSAQSADQFVSVVFVMDYSVSVTNTARATMEQAVINFVNDMKDGDEAAIIKFNTDAGASVIQAFTAIDHGAGNAALAAAAQSDYPGNGTNLLDALALAVNQIVSPPHALPAGPNAIIVITDGGENDSAATQAEVTALANANSTPIFTIGVGDLTIPGREDLLEGLGGDTGGQYYPTATDQEIADAYASISNLLANEYLILIPSGISDCAEHTMEVAVDGQAEPAVVTFTRRTCDTEPNPFAFANVNNVAPGATVTSETVTITGIEVPAHISVISGQYSIGCNGTFTRDPGTIANGDTVCVRQQAAQEFSTSRTATLTIGGVAGTYTATTRADRGGGGGGGGGGATGMVELLLGLGLLLAGRRRLA